MDKEQAKQVIRDTVDEFKLQWGITNDADMKHLLEMAVLEAPTEQKRQSVQTLLTAFNHIYAN